MRRRAFWVQPLRPEADASTAASAVTTENATVAPERGGLRVNDASCRRRDMPSPSPDLPNPKVAVFATTHWSIVVAAQDAASPQAVEALSQLCQSYWYPVYAYVRRKGHDEHAASDLTQGFFCHLLERNFLRTADRRRGKFRSFLLGCLEYFLAKEWSRAQRQKRGGGLRIVSLEDGAGESRYQAEADGGLDPAKAFERRWATTVIEKGLAGLRQEYLEAGKADFFEHLRPFLAGDGVRYEDLASKVGTTEGALRVAVHRLRQRFGERLREVIAETVSTPEEVEEEVRALLAALS